MFAPALRLAVSKLSCSQVMSVSDSCCRRITTDSFGNLCAALPHLEHLALSAAAAPDLLGAIACLSGLRYLEVADCSRVSDVALSPTKYLTALWSLTLQGLTEVTVSAYLWALVHCQLYFTCFALQPKQHSSTYRSQLQATATSPRRLSSLALSSIILHVTACACMLLLSSAH